MNLLARADVVRQRDPAPAFRLVGYAHVGSELLAAPEHEHDVVRLEERGLLRPLPQEARELGRKRVAGRQIRLLLELVHAALELLDVRGRVLVRGDRLADLLLVAPRRLLELVDVDLDLEQAAEPLAEGNRST